MSAITARYRFDGIEPVRPSATIPVSTAAASVVDGGARVELGASS
ncbi:MAG: hypothetical protein AAF962_15545 [Actinomycetota bacterium]